MTMLQIFSIGESTGSHVRSSEFKMDQAQEFKQSLRLSNANC